MDDCPDFLQTRWVSPTGCDGFIPLDDLLVDINQSGLPQEYVLNIHLFNVATSIVRRPKWRCKSTKKV